ncbi:MAG: glycosyltransferase [Chitinophagales bacterium]
MKKPRLLFFPFDLLSHYLRCLELANELKDRCEIIFLYSSRYKEWLNEYQVFECEIFDADYVMACSKKFDFSWLNLQDMERIFKSQVNAIEKYKPDYVVGDASFTLKMAAAKCNVTYISIVNGYMTKYYDATRRLPQSHPAQKYLSRLPVQIADSVTRFAEQLAFRKVHQPFKKLRKKYGLKKEMNYLDELEGDHTLICDVPELFPQQKLPKQYHVIGPLFYSSDHSETAIVEKLQKDKLVILVSLGSTGDWQQLRLLNDARFHEFNIVTAGDHDSILRGEHIIAKPFLNTTFLLPFVDLMICHGGNGTLYQALSHNIPVLAITSHFEQEYNMQRLEALNLGKVITQITSAVELSAIIREALGKKSKADFSKLMIRYSPEYRKEVLKEVIK